MLLACGAQPPSPERPSAAVAAVVASDAHGSEGVTAPAVAKKAHPGVARAGSVAEPLTLRFLDDFNVPRPQGMPTAAAAAWDGALGGLSGLHYVEAERRLYAVTDDPARFPPRLYTFDVVLEERSLVVTPRAVVLLSERTPSELLVGIDCEALTGNGHELLLATEPHESRPPQREARLLRLSPAGVVSGEVPLPSAWLPAPEGEPPRGVRTNLGLEALGLSPSGRALWAGVEAPLAQDGLDATFDAGALVRFARFDIEGARATEEHFYRTEPVARAAAGEVSQAFNGVSDLLALDDERLLVLERAWVVAGGVGKNTVRVFEVTPAPSARARASDTELPLLDKRLVLDFDTIVDVLEPGYQQLDNFEGMARGPRLPDGTPSVLVVSDDNFGARQRTVFVAFALGGAAR